MVFTLGFQLAKGVVVSVYFEYGIVDQETGNQELLDSIYRLRYQVYVNEWGFEEAKDHPDGTETDAYDTSSVHFYAHYDGQDDVIGTIRLIVNSDLGFPIGKEFSISELPEIVPRDKIAEISRLAVSKNYRRRAIDRAIFGHNSIGIDEYTRLAKKHSEERRKSESELVRGLYLAIYRHSKQQGLTHWYAVMARGLFTMLARWGIRFEQVGPERDYHGIRAPYLVRIEEIEKTLARKNPELLQAAKASLIN